MDWSKATNILIALFLALDLALGVYYFQQQQSIKDSEIKAVEDTQAYLDSKGIKLDCIVPLGSERMPVLFVSIEKAEDESWEEYQGHKLILTGSSGFKAYPLESGDARGRTISASRALQKLVSEEFEPGELSGLLVKGMELVYWVDREEITDGEGEDTAVPAWLIYTSRGSVFINALQ